MDPITATTLAESLWTALRAFIPAEKVAEAAVTFVTKFNTAGNTNLLLDSVLVLSQDVMKYLEKQPEKQQCSQTNPSKP